MKISRVLLSLSVSSLLLLLTYLLLERREIVGDAHALQQWSDRYFLPTHAKRDRYVFVDISTAQVLIPDKYNEGKTSITDRRLLTHFFRFLNAFPNQTEWLLCDIFFDLPAADSLQSRYDDSLRVELQRFKRMTVARRRQVPNIFPHLSEGVVSKQAETLLASVWQLDLEGAHTLPWAMYLQKNKPQRGYLHWHNVPIAWYHPALKRNGEFLSLSDAEDWANADEEGKRNIFEQVFKGKIIVLGSMQGYDIHATPLGDMQGAIILLNTYLSLEAGRHKIPLLWLACLWLVYALLAYRAFYAAQLHKQLPAFLKPIARSYTFRYTDYLWFFLGLSALSYYAVGLHLPVLSLFVFFRTLFALRWGFRLEREVERLLFSIMPERFALELKEKGKVMPVEYAHVSIMFADVKGFSIKGKQLKREEASLRRQGKTPEGELLRLINETFSKMDEICQKHGVERIKTIGDCYMCASGIASPSPTHALDIILAALEIQHWIIEEHERRQGDFWKARIGVHTGKVIAGVIGTQRYAYDIWGDDVNIASRMETKGKVDRVNVTAEVFALTADFFEWEDRGMITLKNEEEGLHHAYLVARIKPELSADAGGYLPNEKFYALCKEKFKE